MSNLSHISHDDLDIEEINWDSIRNRVLAINLGLAEAIDDISSNKKRTFFKAKYPYGARIVDKGKFYLPTKQGELVYVNDPKMPADITKKISGFAIPLCLVLSHSNEVFVETNQRVVPLNFFHPGDLFGVFEVINQITQISSKPMWSVTAGARTTFLLPRVNDAIGHNKIRKELNISAHPPKNLFDQFLVFKEIAQKGNGGWENEILIFTNEWFVETKQQSAKLYRFLLTLCWKQLQLFRDAVESALRWSSFAEEMGNRNMKPRPYLVDVVKHLTSITHGAAVALIPAIDSSALPIDVIQQTYTEIYGLKHYLPTIMQPTKFTHMRSVYFSLSFSTILESSPHVRNAPSIMDDCRELKRLTEVFTQAVLKHHNLAENDPITCTKYDFFHTEEDPYTEINTSKAIIEQDERFIFSINIFNERVACDNAPFFRGCVRVSHKNAE